MRGVRRMSWLGLLILGGCASSSLPLPKGWESVPAAAVVGDYCAVFECAARPQLPSIHLAGNRILNGSKPLTPEFVAIDSCDVSLARKEIVFSAKRKDN